MIIPENIIEISECQFEYSREKGYRTIFSSWVGSVTGALRISCYPFMSPLLEAGEEKIYNINVENSHLLQYLRKQKSDEQKELIRQKYVTGMRLIMLGIENAMSRIFDVEDAYGNEEMRNYVDDFGKLAANGAAATILWLTDQLPKVVKIADDED